MKEEVGKIIEAIKEEKKNFITWGYVQYLLGIKEFVEKELAKSFLGKDE